MMNLVPMQYIRQHGHDHVIQPVNKIKRNIFIGTQNKNFNSTYRFGYISKMTAEYYSVLFYKLGFEPRKCKIQRSEHIEHSFLLEKFSLNNQLLDIRSLLKVNFVTYLAFFAICHPNSYCLII